MNSRKSAEREGAVANIMCGSEGGVGGGGEEHLEVSVGALII